MKNKKTISIIAGVTVIVAVAAASIAFGSKDYFKGDLTQSVQKVARINQTLHPAVSQPGSKITSTASDIAQTSNFPAGNFDNSASIGSLSSGSKPVPSLNQITVTTDPTNKYNLPIATPTPHISVGTGIKLVDPSSTPSPNVTTGTTLKPTDSSSYYGLPGSSSTSSSSSSSGTTVNATDSSSYYGLPAGATSSNPSQSTPTPSNLQTSTTGVSTTNPLQNGDLANALDKAILLGKIADLETKLEQLQQNLNCVRTVTDPIPYKAKPFSSSAVILASEIHTCIKAPHAQTINLNQNQKIIPKK